MCTCSFLDVIFLKIVCFYTSLFHFFTTRRLVSHRRNKMVRVFKTFRLFFIIFPVLDDTVSFAFEFVRTRLPYASRVPQKEGSGDSFLGRRVFHEGRICPACRGLLGLERMVRRWNRCIRKIFTRLMDLFVLIANERLCSWSLGSSRAEAFEFRIERF